MVLLTYLLKSSCRQKGLSPVDNSGSYFSGIEKDILPVGVLL